MGKQRKPLYRFGININVNVEKHIKNKENKTDIISIIQSIFYA